MVINEDCTTNGDGWGIGLQLLRDGCAKVLAKEQLCPTVAPSKSRNKCTDSKYYKDNYIPRKNNDPLRRLTLICKM